MATDSAGLFECKQLLRAERFVVDLRCSLDQVLEMGTSEEVAEVDEFAMVLILNCRNCQKYGLYCTRLVRRTVDYAPTILATANLPATDNDCLFGANNGEWNHGLEPH